MKAQLGGGEVLVCTNYNQFSSFSRLKYINVLSFWVHEPQQLALYFEMTTEGESVPPSLRTGPDYCGIPQEELESIVREIFLNTTFGLSPL